MPKATQLTDDAPDKVQEKTVRTTIRIPEKMKRAVRLGAADKDISMDRWIQEAIRLRSELETLPDYAISVIQESSETGIAETSGESDNASVVKAIWQKMLSSILTSGDAQAIRAVKTCLWSMYRKIGKDPEKDFGTRDNPLRQPPGPHSPKGTKG